MAFCIAASLFPPVGLAADIEDYFDLPAAIAAAPSGGTVTLTNTQTYPFNNSGKTVALATPRDTLDYFVNIEVVSETGGSAGIVTVYNKLANGFSVKFDGSAKSVTIRYNVTGGGI